MTQKLYKTILADPPWDIQQTGSKGAIAHYNLMTLDEIKAMPVADLCEENAHCWLWVTESVLLSGEGVEVLKAWGFIPRGIFNWIKPRMGLSNYLRHATEYIIFGTRGKAPILFKSQPNWSFAPVQDHSHKPEEIHKIAERCSPAPYLELFARRSQPGWDAWGNEIESDVVIPGYPVPKYKKEVK